MILGRKVLSVSVFLLGGLSSVSALEHNCERELVPIVDPSITGLEFQKVLLYEHSDNTGLTARVANRTSKRIVAVYTAFEAYSSTGDYLISFTVISRSDTKEDLAQRRAIRNTPEGLEPGQTHLNARFYPGISTTLQADSSQSLGTCDVVLRVRRLWLEFEDQSVLSAQTAGWNSDALPKEKGEVRDQLPKECWREIASVTVTEQGRAVVEGVRSSCLALRELLESVEYSPALRDGKPVARTYRIVFRGEDSRSSLNKRDFGEVESVVFVTTSTSKCTRGISASWGSYLFIVPEDVVAPPECPDPVITAGEP